MTATYTSRICLSYCGAYAAGKKVLRHTSLQSAGATYCWFFLEILPHLSTHHEALEPLFKYIAVRTQNHVQCMCQN